VRADSSRKPAAAGAARSTRPALVFAAGVAAGAAFVWWSGGALPAVVASHFAPGGGADGFMPRDAYLGFMIALVVAVPTLLYLLGGLAARLPVRTIHVPNRQYWLAPERRAATVASFARFGVWAACATLALLCALHCLVLRANAARPAHLEQAPLIGFVSLYLLTLFVAMAVTLARFFRAP
jgi:hypothetical protein